MEIKMGDKCFTFVKKLGWEILKELQCLEQKNALTPRGVDASCKTFNM